MAKRKSESLKDINPASSELIPQQEASSQNSGSIEHEKSAREAENPLAGAGAAAVDAVNTSQQEQTNILLDSEEKNTVHSQQKDAQDTASQETADVDAAASQITTGSAVHIGGTQPDAQSGGQQTAVPAGKKRIAHKTLRNTDVFALDGCVHFDEHGYAITDDKYARYLLAIPSYSEISSDA